MNVVETADPLSGAIYGFDIEGSAEAIDAASFIEKEVGELPYKKFVAGLAEWTANLQMRYDTEESIPLKGDRVLFASRFGVVSNVSVSGEVDGLIEVMVTVKGKGALPGDVNAAGTTISFSVADDVGQLYAGDAVVTSMRVAGQVGGIIEYSMTSQGTDKLTTGAGV